MTDVIQRYLASGSYSLNSLSFASERLRGFALSKINDMVIENMINWRYSGFKIYCGKAIWPHNEEGLENLADGIYPLPTFKKSGSKQTGELGPNLPKWLIPNSKITVDNKTHLAYSNYHSCS